MAETYYIAIFSSNTHACVRSIDQLASPQVERDIPPFSPGPQVGREEVGEDDGVRGPEAGEAAVARLGAVGLRVVVLGGHAVLGVGHVVPELLHVHLEQIC